MITADQFIAEATARGFDFYTGVPCSYLTPLINGVSSSRALTYVGAASEGEAVAIAAGAWLAGRNTVVMCQNSGLGNAVNPLTSLNAPFRIPTLLVTTWRAEPGGAPDEPQHEVMGRITPDLLNLMGVPHALFPREPEEVAERLDAAADSMGASGLPYALIMRKGDVADTPLDQPPLRIFGRGLRAKLPVPQTPPFPSSRAAVLQSFLRLVDAGTAVIATTGKCGRELFTLADRPQHLYQVGSMGGALGMGLGVALNTEKRVVVLDGDGAALMKLGTMATVGAYRPKNLIHILLDNGVHDSTGGQATVSASVDFASVALACGYAGAASCRNVEEFEAAFYYAKIGGPFLIHVRIQPGAMEKLGRPTVAPHEVARRFKDFLAAPSPPWPPKAQAASLPVEADPPVLLTPGPLTTAPEVRAAMLRDWGSRDAAFIALTAELRERLLAVANGAGSHIAVPIQGSGSYVLEAAVGTLIRPTDKLLVLINGAYGERMAAIARRLGRPTAELRWAEDAPVDPAEIARAFALDPAITHVALVHCETTSGMLNPLAAVAAAVAQGGRRLILDAMSSFGALPIDLAATPIQAVLASSNKCLEGTPGLAFALVERGALASAEGVSPSLSLDLHAQWRGFEANGQWRFTPPVQVAAACVEALRRLEAEGGPSARLARYQANLDTLISGMAALGFEPLLHPDHQAPIIATFRPPTTGAVNRRFNFQRLYDGLAARGFLIYPGKLTKAESFRIGCIGAIDRAVMARCVEAVDEVMAEIKAEGRGAAA